MITKIFGRDALRGWIIASAAMVAVSSLPAAPSTSTASNRGAAQTDAKTQITTFAAAYALDGRGNFDADHRY